MYGKNLTWYLQELENSELEQIEFGEIEIYGSDDDGNEGSCEIEITSLAKESRLRIEELTNLLQLCVNDMYKPSGKISKPTASKLLSACQRELVEFPQ